MTRNHLMKVAHALGVNEFIAKVCGRSGGLGLARSPKDINIEADIYLVEHQPSLAEYLTEEVDAKPIAEPRRALRKSVDVFLGARGQYALVSPVDVGHALRCHMFEGNPV
ncbi:hypothetical protein [uncultured Tateyamaria sp.]|uniref:hypothetical protein n=1 Tax=uncultured Tateyamaria sp. TaxID=455651 RepID=UPI00262C52E3|nr:hypothetical protein [uncultured Tateyamaria sp.]